MNEIYKPIIMQLPVRKAYIAFIFWLFSGFPMPKQPTIGLEDKESGRMYRTGQQHQEVPSIRRTHQDKTTM